MKRLYFTLILIFTLLQTQTFANECFENTSYRRALDRHTHVRRLLTINFDKRYKNKCSGSKAHKNKCRKMLEKYQADLKKLDDSFLNEPLNLHCSQTNPTEVSEVTQEITTSESTGNECEIQAKEIADVVEMMKPQFAAANCKLNSNSEQCQNIIAELSARKTQIENKFPCTEEELGKIDPITPPVPVADQAITAQEHRTIRRGAQCLTTDVSLASQVIVTWHQRDDERTFYYTSCANFNSNSSSNGGNNQTPTPPQTTPTAPGSTGFTIVGLNNGENKCSESQLAVQYCRDFGKDLAACQIQGNYVMAKCGEKQEATNDLCMDGSETLSLLAGATTLCEVSISDYEKYKACLTAKTISDRERLCKSGCTSKPNGNICQWSNVQKRDYLGCTGYLTLSSLNNHCAPPPPTNNPPPTSSGPTSGGRIITWKSVFQLDWPQPRSKRIMWFSIPENQYVAVSFRTSSQTFKGSMLHIGNTSGSGLSILSISKKAGDFNVPKECKHTFGLGGGVGYAVNLPGPAPARTCVLEPNTEYFVNHKWSSYPKSGPCADKPEMYKCSRMFQVFDNSSR